MSKNPGFKRYLVLFITLLPTVLVLGGAAPLCAQVQPPFLDASTPVAVHGGQGNLWLSLGDGHAMPASFFQKDAGIPSLQAGAAMPLSMAGEDFDADGYPDLVCGYSVHGSGMIAVFRGNPGAFAPMDPDYFKDLADGKTPSPFLAEALALPVPVAPDCLAAGDFNGDGWPDLLVGAKGNPALYLLRGGGTGGFSDPEAISLPGNLTALTTGTIDLPVGRSSVIAAVDGIGGASLVIFQGADDLRTEAPSLCPLPAPASELALGQLDNAIPMDLAILAEGRILILHGRDQRADAPSDPAQRLESVSLPSEARSIALGRFIWTRTVQTQIAVLDAGGTLSILNAGDPDTRPFSIEEIRERRLALFEHRPLPGQAPASDWIPGASPGWTVASRIAEGLNDSPRISLQSARLSAQAADDIVLSDASGRTLRIFYPEIAGRNLTGSRSLLSLVVEGNAAAVRSMRVNADGRPGLIVLRDGRPAPTVMPLLAATYYTVTGTGDSTASTPTGGSGTVGSPYLMATLRGAIIKANADVGPGTINFAASTNGTPITLTIPGLETDSYAGDLDINDALTVIGNGTASTILQGGTTATNGIDKIFMTNATGAVGGFPVSVSGITFRYGKNTHPWDTVNYTMEAGAMYFWNGYDNAGSFVLSNCVFDQNQAATPGVAGSAGGRGGALAIDAMGGGAITISNCTFSNNKTNRGLGGAIGEGSNGAAVTLTNCSISNNQAGTAYSAEGGGLYSSTDTSGSLLIHNCSFSGNTATSRGGGLSLNLGTGATVTLDQNSSVANNTSYGTLNGVGEGGGIYASGYTGTTTFTLNGVTITGNTAGSASGENRGGGGLAFASGNQTVKFCRIVGNAAFNGNPPAPDWGRGLHKDYNGGIATAINNWWGCNAGPGSTGCDSAIHSHCCPPLPPVNGSINTATWLVLQIAASQTSINTGATSTLTANLNHNNLGATVAGPDYVPSGTSVAFGGTLGTSSPSPVGTTNGSATSTFTAGSTGGSGSGTATVDNQTVSAAITITCMVPNQPCSIYMVQKVGANPKFNWQDPNGANQRTGWNIRRSNNKSLTPKTAWPLIGTNVADADGGAANYQWTDASGDNPGAGGIWYYLITTYNANCPAEGPF